MIYLALFIDSASQLINRKTLQGIIQNGRFLQKEGVACKKFSAKERTFSVPVISSFQVNREGRVSSMQIASLVLIRKFQICLFLGHIPGKIETPVKSRFTVLGAKTLF